MQTEASAQVPKQPSLALSISRPGSYTSGSPGRTPIQQWDLDQRICPLDATAFVIGNPRSEREPKLLIRDTASCQEATRDLGGFYWEGSSWEETQASKEGRGKADTSRGRKGPRQGQPVVLGSRSWGSVSLRSQKQFFKGQSWAATQESRGGWDHPSDPCFLEGNKSQSGASGESPYQWRKHKRWGFDPWVGKIPWRRAWQLTPVFLPGESLGQRSLPATVQGVAKRRTQLKRLSMHAHARNEVSVHIKSSHFVNFLLAFPGCVWLLSLDCKVPREHALSK